MSPQVLGGERDHLTIHGYVLDVIIHREPSAAQIDQRSIGTAGGSVEVAVYNGLFEVPLLGFKKPMRLFAPKINRVNYNVLIGRSLLKDYIVNFNGPTGEVHFIHPRDLPRPVHDDGDDHAT